MRGLRSLSSYTRRAGHGQRGFTLIELITVVAIIITISSIALLSYVGSVQRGREAVLREDLFRMRDAIDQYYADKGKYPVGLEDLVSSGYLRKIPVDPITKSDSTWQTVPAEPDPNNPTLEPGIYNVTSGAEGNASDGSKYSDW